ncbi:MAG: hypothetical protein K0S07_1156 [Chlamydiales bacterium]|jgi:hypothetical protein|nr:hypothetical protein [Chlamydiales bacterium]
MPYEETANLAALRRSMRRLAELERRSSDEAIEPALHVLLSEPTD